MLLFSLKAVILMSFLALETVCSSKMMVFTYKYACCHNAEEKHFCHENLKCICCCYVPKWSWGCSVSFVTHCGRALGVQSLGGSDNVSCSKVKCSHGVMLTIHPHLVLRLRTSRATPPVLRTSAFTALIGDSFASLPKC